MTLTLNHRIFNRFATSPKARSLAFFLLIHNFTEGSFPHIFVENDPNLIGKLILGNIYDPKTLTLNHRIFNRFATSPKVRSLTFFL